MSNLDILGALRILCVDDEEDTLKIFKRSLEATTEEQAIVDEMDALARDVIGGDSSRGPGTTYEVTLCRQSEQALDEFRRALEAHEPFAIAFVDIRMPPGPDGIWAAEQIRALDPHVEIVIVTGFSEISADAIAERVPPRHKLLYLQKPLHVAEIVQFAAALGAKWRTERVAYRLYRDMEKRIADRTAELEQSNARLHREIEERIRAENELISSRERYQDLFENAHDMIQSVNTDGRFMFANRSWQDTLGYTTEDLEKLSIFDIIHPRCLEHCKIVFFDVMSGQAAIDFETAFVAKDGREVLVEGSVVPKIDNGVVVATHGFFRDLTQRRRTEEELKETLQNLRKSFGGIVQVITATVETRDPYTAGHQSRVADLARTVATKMGLSKEQIEGIRIAGVVHDLGKISVPSEILTKPGRLSEVEFSLIKEHCRVGYQLLKPINFPWPVAEIVYQHHEKIDGSGYPQGLKGEDIVLEAKIIGLADVVEAMASHRPYRPALGVASALQEIKQKKGTHFDPAAVDACLAVFQDDGYAFK